MEHQLNEEYDFQKELELRYSKYQSNDFTHEKFIAAGFNKILKNIRNIKIIQCIQKIL